MSNIQIISSGKYIPEIKITNEELEKKYQVEENYILKRTGIKQRYYTNEEIEQLAIKASKEALHNVKEKIDLIIVASISGRCQMPSISYEPTKIFRHKKLYVYGYSSRMRRFYKCSRYSKIIYR